MEETLIFVCPFFDFLEREINKRFRTENRLSHSIKSEVLFLYFTDDLIRNEIIIE